MALAEDTGLAEICEELDQIILYLFDALEMLQTKREAFNSLVEQGWFSLSKSRYAMGNKSVSTLQYGHQMIPLVRVKTSKKEKGQVEFHVVSEDVDAPKQKVIGAVEEFGPSEQVLRRRKGPGKTEAPTQPQNATSKPTEGLGHPNPLNWFGILVPQSLRQAQKTFQEGIHLAAEIASLQSEIETIRRCYRELLGKKQDLIARRSSAALEQL
ncbi:coiled-coil domain-containing protein 115 [Rhineura floridana]|uniref:coiled-coil domain-containing protein 115 n=1 Tax=Rhineura floridana TaxID=261503 RepID=UPI002AC84D20|nr:coiled-coil domain-containing protein 115 [Rhineura floridana]XP_061470388.1 coiled-coil domain-containing protein 115 [Rhineura floridana]XP_061470389.1 coiled-coil domain-containing protein 115 [Rhineura floridana]